MKRLQWLGSLSAAALLGMTFLGSPAQASGGPSGGGGGGNGGGGSKSGVTTTATDFDDWGDYYNGMLPHGRATFAYSADGTSKSLGVQVSSVNVPDGTVMYLETVEQWVSPTGNGFSISYYPVTIFQGKGTLSLSTASGDSVTFLPPSAGQTNVYLWNGPLKVPLMGAQLGHLN